jgi:hypothetical protein
MNAKLAASLREIDELAAAVIAGKLAERRAAGAGPSPRTGGSAAFPSSSSSSAPYHHQRRALPRDLDGEFGRAWLDGTMGSLRRTRDAVRDREEWLVAARPSDSSMVQPTQMVTHNSTQMHNHSGQVQATRVAQQTPRRAIRFADPLEGLDAALARRQRLAELRRPSADDDDEGLALSDPEPDPGSLLPDEVMDLLRCPSCSTILRRPVSLGCGHALCEGCYGRLVRTSREIGAGAECPDCRRAVPAGLAVNQALAAIMAAALREAEDAAALPASFPPPPLRGVPALTIERGHLVIHQRLLGEGAFGAVRAGEYKGEPVAVKELLPANLSGPHAGKMARSLMREISVLALLVGSPSVVRLVGVVSDGPRSLIVTELMRGGSLAGLLADRRAALPAPRAPAAGPVLPVPAALRIAMGVLSGLAHLHACGFSHRDVRPANVLLTSKDTATLEAKLSDFGLAKRVRGLDTEASAAANNNLSSFGRGVDFYIAPEMIRKAAYSHEKVDVFSAGLLLLELFTGERPFTRSCDRVEHLVAEYATTPWPQMPSPGAFPPGTPKQVIDLAERMYSRDPNARPTAQEAHQALGFILAAPGPVI